MHLRATRDEPLRRRRHDTTQIRICAGCLDRSADGAALERLRVQLRKNDWLAARSNVHAIVESIFPDRLGQQIGVRAIALRHRMGPTRIEL